MSISIHELLAVARESEGVKAVKGDAILCEKRFATDTRYMVEFLLLEQKEWFGKKGEYHRYFLTKEAYREPVSYTHLQTVNPGMWCFRMKLKEKQYPGIMQKI